MRFFLTASSLVLFSKQGLKQFLVLHEREVLQVTKFINTKQACDSSRFGDMRNFPVRTCGGNVGAYPSARIEDCAIFDRIGHTLR